MCEEHREDDGENSRQRGHRGGYGIDNTDNGRLVMLSFAAVSIPRERGGEAGVVLRDRSALLTVTSGICCTYVTGEGTVGRKLDQKAGT